jgi:restriction endonuclease Mrr
MTAALLEGHLGWTILQRSTRGVADQGVDILATRSRRGKTELLVAQCKCYAASKYIEPATIRELMGSMQLVDDGSVNSVKGLVVTTSNFTSGAMSVAAQQGIELINGAQFAQLCAEANKASFRGASTINAAE